MLKGNRIAALAVLAALSAFSAWGDEPAAIEPDPFPELEGLSPNIEFWARVFAEWTRGQVAIHDLEYPALVYEVVELPGPIGDRYSEEQRSWLETVREDWEYYLAELERKIADEDPLEEIDQQWAVHFASVVGIERLEGAHERVRSQRGLRERFREGLERSYRLDGTIRAILREHGLPEDLAYLPHVESSFQYGARSSAGATGLWQFTRGTGKRYLRITSAIDERLDPIAATRGAADYLRDAYDKLGTWPLALTSYNHGVQGMLRAKQRFGTDFEKIVREYDGRLFGFASKNFYAEFLAARRIASDPDTYFPEGFTPEAEFDLESVVLDSRVTPGWIATRYGVPIDDLASLNPGWSRRAVRSGLRLPAGTEVWLPKGTLDSTADRGSSTGAGARPAADGGSHYVVRRGDTLSEIADAYGISLGELRRFNDLAPRESVIRPGQRLRVAGSPAVHVVQRGETLSEIARTHGVSLSSLRRTNSLAPRESLIRTGQKLRLPDGVAQARERRHVVRRGDTLGRIASRHGVRLSDLLRANGLTMRTTIHPGQSLRIP